MSQDLHDMSRKFWEDVQRELKRNSHTAEQPQEFIDAYRKQLASKGVDVGLIYHRGAKLIAKDIAQQPKPGMFGAPDTTPFERGIATY